MRKLIVLGAALSALWVSGGQAMAGVGGDARAATAAVGNVAR